MFEKIKSAILIILIILSMFLTYTLWFSQPLLEEETVPYYEDVFFTAPPPVSEIIQPSKVIFNNNDQSIHLFCRGCRGFTQLWSKGIKLINEKVELNNAKSISQNDLEGLIETFSSRLVYTFEPSIPINFFSNTSNFEGMIIEEAVFLWDEELLYVIFRGEDNLLLPLGRADDLQNRLFPEIENPHLLLPPLITMNSYAEENNDAEERDPTYDLEVLPSNEQEKEQATEDEEIIEDEQGINWEIETRADIYVPEGDIFAAEVSLIEEEIDHEQLVRAFFIDLSLARRIEERDGALYYTDGEKGLRIYTSGLVEFAFPRLEQILSSISYSHALQKGAESLSLYGGWLAETYLAEAENLSGGYRLCWNTVHEGLALQGEQTGCEMLINEQGVSFYRRNFHIIGEKVTEKKPFRSYEEALNQVLTLNEQLFQEKRPALLSLEPVYYIPSGEVVKAIPAWAVHFEGMEKIYLHWVTLDPLE